MGGRIRQLIVGVYLAIMLAVVTVFALGVVFALVFSAGGEEDGPARVTTIVVTTP